MSKALTCEKCKGQKKVLGMGMLEHNCPKCSGTGICIVQDEIFSNPNKTDIPDTNIPVKGNGKRGRPAKNQLNA